MQLLAFPFRLRGGAVSTVSQDGDSGNADAVARIALCRIGDWPLVPSYGIPDPVFSDLTEASINACLALHGPQDITVTATTTGRDATSESITLSIERVS